MREFEREERELLFKADSLRPKDFAHYIGQDRVKSLLQTAIKSAKMRTAFPDHILLTSYQPGVGKTTLANIIANELGKPLLYQTCPHIRTPKEIGKTHLSL